MGKKKSNKPKILEAWSGPGSKDENITIFKPEFDALHIDMKKRGNTEWWYFDARLEGGYTVVAFFRAKHERTGKTGVEITIYKPNGEKIQNVYDYNRSDLKVSREIADVQIGNNYIKVDYANEKFPTYEVFLEEGEFGLHLNYTAQVPGWMPGKGYTRFGNLGEFGWVVPLPRAKVEGSIKIHNKTLSVKGIGYHDHNWINFNLIRVVDYWHWGRIYSENFTIVYAHIKCNKKMDDYNIKVFMLAKNEDILLSTGEYKLIEESFQYNEKARNSYPKSLKFKLSEQNEINLNVNEIIDADHLLSEFNPILRFLAKNVLKLNPGYFRFNSKFEIKMTHNGTQYKELGNTLHEMVIIK
ncbi:MAG: lipocalin-like domain-containing protein [Promethearchaeota archaeon]